MRPGPVRLEGAQHWGTVVLPRPAFPASMPGWGPGTFAPQWSKADDSAGGAREGLRILMVEDDVALAHMYALRLRRDGHSVTTIHDGQDGLKEALEGDYDLVFLDINLPRLDGITILHRMRQSDAVAGRPVVILSNYSEPPLVARGQELGVRRYLVKSEVSPSEIAANVRGWVKD